MTRTRGVWALAFFLLSACLFAASSDPFHYEEKSLGPAEIKYVAGVPVLFVQGSPEEIGDQIARVAASQTPQLFHYPRDVLRLVGLEAAWPVLLATGKRMAPQFPADYRREIDAMVQAGLDRDLLIVANTMFDIKKLVGCSSLLVSRELSHTGGPLLGRNLDFPSCGYLHQYSLVTIYRPNGKRAFASIGFPGAVGCLSGINDAGLALAVHEVYTAGDGSPRFDPEGVPYAMCFRRLLEECATVAEAVDLLKSMKRSTMMDLVICDRQGGAVLEVTPKNVIVRPPHQGLAECTNHFLSAEVKPEKQENVYLTLDRFRTLEQARKLDKIGTKEIQKYLHEANLGEHTLQTMIFEPAAMKLHLAFGSCPSSALPMKTLDLERFLKMP
jgi:predicted choloylglycine hydrolase